MGDDVVDREGKMGAVLFDGTDRQQQNGGRGDLGGDLRASQIFVATVHESDDFYMTWKKLSSLPWGSMINTLR